MDIIDFYKSVKNDTSFRQFKVDNLLFTEFDCIVSDSAFDYLGSKNYFCYVIEGEAKWKTPTREYDVRVGDAIFLRKGLHRVTKIQKSQLCAVLIFLTDEFIASVLKGDTNLNLTESTVASTDSVIPIALNQSLRDYFNSLLGYFSQERPPSQSLLKIKFKELIINLTTDEQNPDAKNCFKEISLSNKKSIRQVMEENYFFNLKLKDFAELSCRSLASFNRGFVNTYGTTPGKWLKEKRLNYARYLLETSDLNINEITTQSGFENASNFIRVFKKRFNSSPLAYKKKNQLDE